MEHRLSVLCYGEPEKWLGFGDTWDWAETDCSTESLSSITTQLNVKHASAVHFLNDVLYTSEVTNMKMRLNDDLMEFIADASEARWTVTDALQNLYITIAD